MSMRLRGGPPPLHDVLMRYLVLGAGAIGGAIGALLHLAGHDVTLVARGDHLTAIRAQGLRLMSPDFDRWLRIPAVADVGELKVRGGDVVILATKVQDAETAIRSLAGVAPPQVTVVCAQNGIEGERIALRRFASVLSAYVMVPATHLQPGVVQLSCAPLVGVIDVGAYPSGRPRSAVRVSSDLRAAGFDSRCVPDILRWKYAKLLANLGNAAEAALGSDDHADLVRRAEAEGELVYRALGIDATSDAEQAHRLVDVSPLRPVGGIPRPGGSSYQSLARAAGAVETDYLNGEIVLMGRMAGVATPVNEALQRIVGGMAHQRRPPGSASMADFGAVLG